MKLIPQGPIVVPIRQTDDGPSQDAEYDEGHCKADCDHSLDPGAGGFHSIVPVTVAHHFQWGKETAAEAAEPHKIVYIEVSVGVCR